MRKVVLADLAGRQLASGTKEEPCRMMVFCFSHFSYLYTWPLCLICSQTKLHPLCSENMSEEIEVCTYVYLESDVL